MVSDVCELVLEVFELLVEVQCTTLQSSEINADKIAVLIHFHEFDLHLAGFGLNLVHHLLVSEVAS